MINQINSIDELTLIMALGMKAEQDKIEVNKSTKVKEEIYCDDDVDRSGIEECKRRTEDLFKESVWSK